MQRSLSSGAVACGNAVVALITCKARDRANRVRFGEARSDRRRRGSVVRGKVRCHRIVTVNVLTGGNAMRHVVL